MKNLHIIAFGFLGALCFTVLINVPEAYAQAISTGATVDVLSALVGKNVSAAKYQATSTSGQDGFVCAGCRLHLDSGVANAIMYYQAEVGFVIETALKMGSGQAITFDNRFASTANTPLSDYGAWRLVPQSSLGTCGATATPEGAYVQLSATASSKTRICHCIRLTTSGAYRWLNDDTKAAGTTTDDCPEST